MSRRLVAGAAVGTSLVLTLAACGSAGSGKAADAGPGGAKLTANEVLLRTSQKTAQVSSFSADVSLSAKGDNGTTTTSASGKVRLSPTVALTGTLNNASFGGFNLNSSVPFVLVNNALYAKVPSQFAGFLSSVTKSDKPWVKLDLSQAGQKAGLDAASTVQEIANLIDPANLTKTFTASKDVKKVGDQAINGVNTTHYHGTVTVQAALAQLDSATQQKLQPFYAKAGNHTVTFDLWADGNGLARKVVLSPNDTNGKAGTLTVVYNDFNKQVNVSAPPSDQVGDLNLPNFGH